MNLTFQGTANVAPAVFKSLNPLTNSIYIICLKLVVDESVTATIVSGLPLSSVTSAEKES